MKRQERIQSQTVKQYAEKSRSAFFRQAGDQKPMLTFDVFTAIAQQHSRVATIWLDRLAQISLSSVKLLFEQIPQSRISPAAIEFGYQMLKINKNRLIPLREDLV